MNEKRHLCGIAREREWMGVEPTRAAFKHPSDGFEDRGAHQDSTTPKSEAIVIVAQECLRSKLFCRMARVAEVLPGTGLGAWAV